MLVHSGKLMINLFVDDHVSCTVLMLVMTVIKKITPKDDDRNLLLEGSQVDRQ